MSPVEFWKLLPGQIWWIIEAHMPQEQLSREEDMAQIYELMQAADQKEIANGVSE